MVTEKPVFDLLVSVSPAVKENTKIDYNNKRIQ